MYLPLRIAAALTVTIVVCGLMVVAFWHALQSKLPLSLAFMQSGGLVLMAGTFMLPVVIPNVIAAWVANRVFGFGNPLLYAGMFGSIFTMLWLVEVNALTQFVGADGFGPEDVDWKVAAFIAFNVAICLGAAWWYGRGANA